MGFFFYFIYAYSYWWIISHCFKVFDDILKIVLNISSIKVTVSAYFK